MHDILKVYNHINNFGRDQEMEYQVLSPGVVEYSFTVKKEHMATPVAIHGGMLAAYMDAILGVAALSIACEDGNLVSTVEFKINYFKPAKLNDVLIGRGRVESKGKRIIIASADIVEQNSKNMIAKGIGTFNAYPVEKSGFDGGKILSMSD